jgi:hypothetical protein
MYTTAHLTSIINELAVSLSFRCFVNQILLVTGMSPLPDGGLSLGHWCVSQDEAAHTVATTRLHFKTRPNHSIYSYHTVLVFL